MKIAEFLFGYVEYTVADKDVATVAELFLKNGLAVSFKKNKFRKTLPEIRKIEALLATRVKFTKSRNFGIGGFLYDGRKRIGAILSIIVCVLLLIFSSDRIWDIRIDGEGEINEDAIINELEACGFYIGGEWSDNDISNVEIRMLEASNEVSWININRRGTVAYVNVRKKEGNNDSQVPPLYANVVASCDGVIESITVKRGVATVNVGDSVKAGDILISGIIPSELGGGFCCADGVVVAKVFEELTVSVPEIEDMKVAGDAEVCSLSINFFGFSANIFKSFNTNVENCDIIDTAKYLSFLGNKIPVSLYIRSLQPYSTVKVRLTATEMTDLAGEKMASLITERVADSTLVSISTVGSFLDASYVMKSNITYLGEISLTLPFEVVSR